MPAGAERRASRVRTVAALACLLACAPRAPRPAVPLPASLEEMEPAVQRQFREAHEHLTELLVAARASDATRAAAYGRLGMLFHAYELRPGARLAYEEAQRLAPEDFRWPFYRAELELRGGDLALAEQAIRQALALDPDHGAAATLHGEILAGLGRLDEADRLLAERTRLDPSQAAAWAGRARIALMQRDPQRALGYLREAVALQPESTEIQYLLAQAHGAAGDREAAARYLEALPDRNLHFAYTRLDEPLLAEIRRLRLSSLERVRAGARAVHSNLRLALLELDQALATDPGLLHTRASRAWVLLQLGRLDEAEAELRHVLDRDPDHEQSLRFLAALEQRRGDDTAAEALWRRALEVNPVSREARFGLAGVARRRGRLEEALAGYRATAELDPGMALAHFWQAALLDALGRREEARAVLARARRALPQERSLALLEARWAGAGAGAEAPGQALAAAERLLQAETESPPAGAP